MTVTRALVKWYCVSPCLPNRHEIEFVGEGTSSWGGMQMRILLTGASSQVGGYFLREIAKHPIPSVAWSGSRTGRLFGIELEPVDLTDTERVRAAFRRAAPTVVIHAGAVAGVGECYRNPERAYQVNTQGTVLLADLAREAGARMLFLSTDLVFDGEKGSYREDDLPAPLSVYGRTKAAAEQAVRAVPHGLVLRVSLLFGPSIVGHPYFFDEQVAALREGRRLTLFQDEWRTPFSLASAARAVRMLVQSDFAGILHLGGPERMSRLEMGQRLAGYLGVETSTLVAVSRSNVPAAEPRPCDTSLDCSRWRSLFPAQRWPGWHEALAEMGLGR
jgi:dTDP-4-dehydrorhamnose reductase